MTLTYAQSRLWLGISAVGFWVVLSVLILLNLKSLAVWMMPLNSLPITVNLLIYVLGYILLSLPFDFLGGFFLPYQYGRNLDSFAKYSRSWSRGVLVHGAFLFLVAYGFYLLAPWLYCGLWLGGFLTLTVLVQVLLLIFQPQIARLVAQFGVHQNQDASDVWGCSDLGFTGGLTLSKSRFIMPERWLQEFTLEEKELIQLRRSTLWGSANHRRGFLFAILFNVVGLSLAFVFLNQNQITPDTVGILPYFLAWSSCITLWSFLGLLNNPLPSQWGCYEADAVWKSYPANQIEQLLVHLDNLQDEEPTRHDGVQRIFHPIASVDLRLAHLYNGMPRQWVGFYHFARYALYLSWTNLSWLSRAVHCNVGRPHLWVFLPADA